MARSAPSSETRRFRSIHWIVGSTIVLVLVSILGGLPLMLFAARQLDHMQGVRERELVERTVQRDLKRMTRELTSATVWDDAYQATGPTVDLAWADTNFADYYNQYFGHDQTFAVRGARLPTPPWPARVSPHRGSARSPWTRRS
ncbi:CHASE4 domain-containing protein [Caulobacter sp. DWR1-3-2b1]|uniref:CHASE4 domain-containing protein n=1 Tax=Caulobacter sp. DWR1-3-2b1 TaxID=2804670 RepID=UPI003CECE0FA